MDAVKTDKEVLERIKRKIIVLERKNLITKEFTNIEILKAVSYTHLDVYKRQLMGRENHT